MALTRNSGFNAVRPRTRLGLVAALGVAAASWLAPPALAQSDPIAQAEVVVDTVATPIIFDAARATYGPQLSITGVSGPLALVDDGVDTTTDACTTLPAGSLAGKIALADRGNCSFPAKTENVESAGAMALIMADNVAGGSLFIVNGVSATAISTVMVTNTTGDTLKTNLVGGPVSVTLRAKDYDLDGVPDLADNCPDDGNPGQEDSEADGIGDVCDPDVDGDGVANGGDNCPDDANAGQEDNDGDGIGNACDSTPNGSGGGNTGGDDNLEPANEFDVGKVKRKKLTVSVPGPGTVEVSQASRNARSAGNKKLLKPSSATATGAGRLTVKLHLAKRGNRKLKRKGKLKVNAAITFTPTGGTANTDTEKLKLRKK